MALTETMESPRSVADAGNGLLKSAQSALTESPIHALHRLRVRQVADDCFVISGRVKSYYLKQLAQEFVRRVVLKDGYVVNEVQVGDDKRVVHRPR
jgi:hypothetical protein